VRLGDLHDARGADARLGIVPVIDIDLLRQKIDFLKLLEVDFQAFLDFALR
jgi:hypothetical protein